MPRIEAPPLDDKDVSSANIGAAFVIGAIACVLAVMWFGWHLLLILFLFVWANNLSQETDR